jgi:hypothetical protein
MHMICLCLCFCHSTSVSMFIFTCPTQGDLCHAIFHNVFTHNLCDWNIQVPNSGWLTQCGITITSSVDKALLHNCNGYTAMSQTTGLWYISYF